jgi:hypothetical protein
MRDNMPAPARRCDQIKQEIRLSNCTHYLVVTLMLKGGGWIRFCPDCMRVLEVRDPFE